MRGSDLRILNEFDLHSENIKIYFFSPISIDVSRVVFKKVI